MQKDIDRGAANISALTSGKIYKYEYFTDGKILPYDQSIEHQKTLNLYIIYSKKIIFINSYKNKNEFLTIYNFQNY